MYMQLVFVLIVSLIINVSNSSYGPDRDRDRYDDDEIPKNVILVIADGLGINYNTVYRLWKNLESTIYDDYFVGEYSTFAFNQTVIDSSASATAFGAGILPPNGYTGIDVDMNPIANILEAAKRKGKGVGVISNNRITHATPASFSSHVRERNFENLIAHQQGTRVVGDIDILFGGGKRHFLPQTHSDSRRSDDFDLISNFESLGWNSLSSNKDELSSLNENDIPAVGLFSNSHFPDYLERKHNPLYVNIPNLMEMTRKGLELLSSKYNENGFVIMIEASQIDFAGHDNDLAYMISEIEEYYETLNYIINEFMYGREEDDTLLLMVSDHESGGLSIGRASLWDINSIISSPNGDATIDFSTVDGQSEFSFDYDPLPLELKDTIGPTSMYQFYTEPLNYPTKTGFEISVLLLGILDDVDADNQIVNIIETYYVETLTESEKTFVISCINRVAIRHPFVLLNCVTKILNIQCNAGWTSTLTGHTGGDVRIGGLGPGIKYFRGWNGNIQNIGNKLINLFRMRHDINKVNQQLKRLFNDNELVLCDETDAPGFIGMEIGDSIPWPEGNFKYPGFCVQEFV